jgi:SAM-dependent methyltransferase
MYLRARRRRADVSNVELEAEGLQAALLRHGHQGLRGARVLEIGYGARPLLLYWLFGNGVDVTGVDLDVPLLQLAPRDIARVVATNGLERAAKSVGRLVLEGGREMQALEARITEVTGKRSRPPKDRLFVADASSVDFWKSLDQARFDVVFSLGVLEHVPAADLDRLLAGVAGALRPGGLAILRPNVFTGISGGHLHEWYPDQVDAESPKSTLPWEHLRGNRVVANTYLNRLSRRAYVELLERHFLVLEDAPVRPDLGRTYLTDDLRRELIAWDDYELFSNEVTFVVRPRTPV